LPLFSDSYPPSSSLDIIIITATLSLDPPTAFSPPVTPFVVCRRFVFTKRRYCLCQGIIARENSMGIFKSLRNINLKIKRNCFGEQ